MKSLLNVLLIGSLLATTLFAQTTTTTHISTHDYEIDTTKMIVPVALTPRVGTIPVAERGTQTLRVTDPGYTEKYTESVLVVDDTANRALEPVRQSGAVVTFLVKNTNGGVRQSGDFSKEVNAQFVHLRDFPGESESKRRDWEHLYGGSGSIKSEVGPISEVIEPGRGQVTFLRYWTLIQREERQIGAGRDGKTFWREITTRGVFQSSAGYWAHTQQFDVAQGKIVNIAMPTDPLKNRVYTSPELMKGDLNPAGVAKAHWTITFGDGSYTWHRGDTPESGTYKREGDKVILMGQGGKIVNLHYDSVTGFLCNKAATYHPVVDSTAPLPTMSVSDTVSRRTE